MALACDDQFAAWFGPNAARTARKACNDQLGEVQTLLELQGRHVMASLVLGLVQTLLELQGRHVMTSLVLGLVQTPLELQGRHVMTSLLLGLVHAAGTARKACGRKEQLCNSSVICTWHR